MKRKTIFSVIIILGLVLLALISFYLSSKKSRESNMQYEKIISLPAAELKGKLSLEEVLLMRRSVRNYQDQPVTLKEIGQLLWAAQGITDDQFRTAPSAGALYPLEVYVTGEIEGLEEGTYKYYPQEHNLLQVNQEDLRGLLYKAGLEQSSLNQAKAIIVITAVYQRMTGKYGERGVRYTDMEAGHAAQNICLQATSLGLGTVTIGAFEDEMVAELLELPEGEVPLYLMPLGRK